MDCVYRIAKWTETFEKSESRRYKNLTWVSLPVGFNSNGYHELIATFKDDAPTIYGAWCALLSVAAEAPVHGTLANSKGIAYSLDRIVADTRFPREVFEKLIPWAVSAKVGWLELDDPQHTNNTLSTTPCVDVALRDKPNETNTTERTNGRVADRSVGRSVDLEKITVSADGWVEAQPTMLHIAKVVTGIEQVNTQALSDDNWELCVKAAVLAHGPFGRPWLDGVLKSIKRRQRPADNRWGHFRGALIRAANRDGRNFHESEELVELPPRNRKQLTTPTPRGER